MIYLDHHAATPLCAAAREAMQDAQARAWANPASVHAAGRASRALLERARSQVAQALGAASAADLVLTSGGTEACNLGVRGLEGLDGGHLVTTEIEHPAVARAVDALGREAEVRVTRMKVVSGLPPTGAQLAAELRAETRLVAVQWINHETGTMLPVAEYAAVCREACVPLFIDATQAFGKVHVDVSALGADLVAVASHKLGGPAGAGALFVRRGVRLSPLLLGGAQERGLRAGSPDVLHAVGFGAACDALRERLSAQPRLSALRDEVEGELSALGAVLNGRDAPRAATVVNASFAGRRGDALVAALDLEGVCVSSGPACSSGLPEPSPSLRAMYPHEAWRAGAALRLSFGPETTEVEVETALAALQRVLARHAA
ncbi:MAG: cysteine desulfurase family protein [Polyangiales bacterium]